MSKRLLVIAGADTTRTFPLTPGETLLIGRGQASATRLSDLAVSKVHCQVEWEGEHAVVVDHQSKSGTFVNGRRVLRQQLHPGDVIRIGETQLRVEEESTAAAGAAGQETLDGSSPPPGLPVPAAGGVLAGLSGKTLGDYTVGPFVAQGRSGVVFRAQDVRLKRTVALKVFWPEFLQKDEEVQRFVRAIKTMLPLRHPNLVALYAAGKTGAHCWVAMEYVEGESLAEVLKNSGPAGCLDWHTALRVAVHVGRAMEYARHNGIVHRNITPENVLIRRSDGLAKLGDLMRAKALYGMLAEKITAAGELVGEFRYLAPEGTMGGSRVDNRSDIYSLGALVYTLLAGRPPFEAEKVPELLELIRTAEPTPPASFQPSLPAAFEAAVLKMLRKEPGERYQTAAELVRELEQVAAQQGVSV